MTAKNNEDDEVLTPEDGTDNDELDIEDRQDDEHHDDDEQDDQDDNIDDEDEPEGEDDDADDDDDDEDAPPPEDYREKFSASTRQNQILTSQLNELKKQIGDITKQEIPTDDEMIGILGLEEWEALSDRERNTERRFVIQDRRENARVLREQTQNKESELKNSVDDFIDLDENKDIAGMNSEFLEFVKLPKNAGASLEVLKDAFLFKKGKQNKPNKTKSPKSLLRGSSSSGAPVRKPGEMDADELKKLRTSDPKRYNEMIRRGQIK